MRSDPRAAQKAASWAQPGTSERDLLTRGVLLATLATLGIFTCVSLALWGTGVFATTTLEVILATDAAFGLLFFIGLARRWRAVAVALPVLFLLLAATLTYFAGVWSPVFVFFTVPVLLGFTLLDEPAEWLLLGSSLVLYAGISWVRGERDLAALASIVIPVATVQSGLVLLLRFSRERLRRALLEARGAAASLAEEVRERTRAEQSMRDLAEKTRAVFRSIDYGLLLTDLEGRIVDANDTAARLGGASAPEQLLGQLVSSFVPSGDRHVVEDAIRRLTEGHPMEAVRVRLETSENRVFEAEATAVLYRSSSGAPAGVVYVVRDLTRQLQAEAESRHAHKMRAVERLTGGIAHEINNLLLAIRGYAELARQESGVAGGARQHLDGVLGATDRAADLVARLATFGRSGIGWRGTLELNGLVAHLLPSLSAEVGSNIRIELLLAPDLRSTRADPAQITEVIGILCRNARDAMPEGGRITLETANATIDSAFVASNPWAEAGQWICLQVSDTGIGMSPEVQERLFEPFYTTKEHGKGTGLGLATAYEIVRSHGGLIRVRSAVGQGSTFTIYLRPGSDAAPPPDSAGFDADGTIVRQSQGTRP
jgi:PAS domain S-box-containing protein